MRNRDSLYIKNKIYFSMQLQSRYTLRNAADQCGKKSNDIKRAGGIRRFIDDNNAVSKWTMRRTNQA